MSLVPAVGTQAYHRFRVHQAVLKGKNPFGMTKAVRDDMIERLWATGVMDSVDIADSCCCRESTVVKVLNRLREERR
jgi:hypothetical protein